MDGSWAPKFAKMELELSKAELEALIVQGAEEEDGPLEIRRFRVGLKADLLVTTEGDPGPQRGFLGLGKPDDDIE